MTAPDPLKQDVEPALFRHCCTVYEAMNDLAEDGLHGRTYEGFLTHLFNDLDLSVPYYTMVMKKLKAMDCVRQLVRGGGSAPSQWLLLQEPTMELFNATPAAREMAKMAQIPQDVNRRLSVLEEKVDAILHAMADEAEVG